MGIPEITTIEDLKRYIKAGEESRRNVVVEFYAEWCGACKAMRPIYDRLAATHPSVICLKANVDKAKDLSARAGIHSMPTFQAFVHGTRVEEFSGVDERSLNSMLTKYQ